MSYNARLVLFQNPESAISPAALPASRDDIGVLEPLSEPIRQLLLELGLCSPADLRACRRLVSRLTCDLPAFDSVWLDALVQLGRLTPYQARLLESPQPASIRIGPCLAVRQIGCGSLGDTLLARPIGSDELCVIKHLNSGHQLPADTIARLEQAATSARTCDHPSIIAPQACVRVENRVVLISRYAPGSHLADLVIRRGRFPATVVWDIGRQLASGLAALGQCQLVHGDIRTSNVRLDADGTAVLVDAVIRPVLEPTITLHSGLTPEHFDGIAPELIGVGGRHNTATDAYALGCLLWQLLAGRPPFPGGDPLIKIAAHQTRAIEDIRHWAPDVPERLALGIARLVSRNPADRPSSFQELLEFWGHPSSAGQHRLRRFRRDFDLPARSVTHSRPLSTPTRWLFIAASLFTLSGGVALLVNPQARTTVLAWGAGKSHTVSPGSEPMPQPARRAAARDERTAARPAQSQSGRLPLPSPDRQGIVRLENAGPYRISDLTVVGPLTIVGDETIMPQLIIDDQPFKLCAETVRLKNLRIITEPAPGVRPGRLRSLVRIETQSLVVESCLFDAGTDTSPPPAATAPPYYVPPTGPALVAWKLIDATDPRGGAATMRNCVLRGDGPALYLAHAVRQVSVDNVLRTGHGPLVQLASQTPPRSALDLKLSHTTIRSGGPLLRWVVPADDESSGKSAGRPSGPVQIETNDCVLEIASPQSALCELAGATPRPEWLRAMHITGEGSITRPQLELAAWVANTDGRITALESDQVDVEGLIAAEFQFVGEATGEPAASEVREVDAPRRSPKPPGIHATALSALTRDAAP